MLFFFIAAPSLNSNFIKMVTYRIVSSAFELFVSLFEDWKINIVQNSNNLSTFRDANNLLDKLERELTQAKEMQEAFWERIIRSARNRDETACREGLIVDDNRTYYRCCTCSDSVCSLCWEPETDFDPEPEINDDIDEPWLLFPVLLRHT